MDTRDAIVTEMTRTFKTGGGQLTADTPHTVGELAAALDALAVVMRDLRSARAAGFEALDCLTDARRARVNELNALIAAALGHANRLATCLIGDLRACDRDLAGVGNKWRPALREAQRQGVDLAALQSDMRPDDGGEL